MLQLSNRPIRISIFLFLLTSCMFVNAQDSIVKVHEFVISAQVRPEFEMRYGYHKPTISGLKPAALISQRNRIGLNYNYKQLLSLRLIPQYIFIWGQDGLSQGKSTQNTFSLFEVWIKLQPTKAISFTIGRQVIALDDERFFGESDFGQSGRAHDALSFQFKQKKIDLRAFFAYNQNYKELYGNSIGNTSGSLYTSKNATPYKWMQTAWAGVKFNDKNKMSFLFSNFGYQEAKSSSDSAKTHFSQTIGVNYFYADSLWSLNASAYFQGGKNKDGVKTNAYLLAFLLNRRIGRKWNVGFGTDFLSGNAVGYAPKKSNHAFSPAYGTNHKFYGSMDYFFAGNAHKNTGLADIYAKVGFNPTKKSLITLAFHQFLSPNKMQDSSNRAYKRNLGQEIDFGFKYQAYKFVKVSGAYSLYITTPSILFLKDIPNARKVQHWLWLSLDVNLDIFKFRF
ncbi:MAG: hypothetical protein KDD21_07020 [Bacteroidetes bacterium]|nr:hypothetical protein [Bacteroidota bacterium]